MQLKKRHELLHEIINYMDWLPVHIRNGVANYIEYGIEPGGFLEAVICNDLKSACARADGINQHKIHDIVQWFYNFAPVSCWGNEEKYRDWITQR